MIGDAAMIVADEPTSGICTVLTLRRLVRAERFARGEIDADEYHRRLTDLRDSATAARR